MGIKQLVIGLVGLLLLLGGCNRGGDGVGLEKDDDRFQRGQRYYREGRYQESMVVFLSIIESRRDAPQSHLELGRLYLEHLNDPLAGIYHFKKFLEMKPDVEQSPIVRQMIERAKKTFAQTLPGRPFDDDVSRVDLMDLLKQVQEENLALKKRNAGLTKASMGSGVVKVGSKNPVVSKAVMKAEVEKFSAYTVEAGDTLSKISGKVYGNVGQWEVIYQANKESLKAPNDLKIGQVLKIPVKANRCY